MTPERHEQIGRLYHEALALTPEQRAPFLRDRCAGDELLQREVEALLALDSRAEGFLEAPALDVAAGLLAQQRVPLAAGRRLGHFQVLSLLGTGGMGEVYLAEDVRLGRRIALKLLPPAFTRDADRLWRFEREARAASSLNQPNILTIHEIGHEDELHYIATEFIEGQTVRRQLEGGRLALRAALDIAVQVASALASAHAAGIVHRDIKPENLMIRPDGLVKVLDFGLAKLLESDVAPSAAPESRAAWDVSDPGRLMGTARYMSPEQARGVPVDARSDLFSLGVVIYEMVAGRPPFEAESSTGVLTAIAANSPAPLRSCVPDAPAELERIVVRALEKEREARYQTAGELLLDLQRLCRRLDFETELAAAPIDGRQRRRQGALVALAVCLALAAGLVLVHKAVQQNQPPPPVLKIVKLTANGRTSRSAISPDGKYVAYFRSEADGTGLWIREMETGSHTRILPASGGSYHGLSFSPTGDSLYFTGEEQTGRGLALYQLPAPLGGTPRQVLTDVGEAFSLSPDGRRVVFVRAEKELIVAALDGSGEQLLLARQTPDSLQAAAWAPDGKRIACFGWSQGAEANVTEVNLENGAQQSLTRNWSWIHELAWLPDGRGLALIANDKQESTAQLWRLSTPNGEVRRVTTDLSDYFSLSLTRDGRAVVMTQSSSVYNLWVMQSGDASRARQITSDSMAVGGSGLAWTPDGRIVYSSFASGRPEIWRMNVDGTDQQQLTVDLGSNFLGLAVSPDGRYIAFVSDRGGESGIWRMERNGANPTLLAKGGRLPFFSPDSQWIYFRRQEAVWKVPAAGGETRRLTGPTSFLLDISADGKWIAYRDPATKKIAIGASDGTAPVRIFDRIPPTDRRPMPRWLPDGSALSYLTNRGGISNLWLQPLDGSPPRPVTDLKTDQIHYYAWSRDGRSLAFASINRMVDVVMISNF